MKPMKMLALFAALLACGSVHAAKPAPSAQVAPAVDLMTMTQDTQCHQVVVTCLVNGQPMRMMLDTGATHTVLHEESAARLKNAKWVDTSKMKFRGNSSQRPRLVLASLQAGPAESSKHPVMVLNLGAVRSMMAEKIDGILGMDILASVPFTFDMRSGDCYGGVPEGGVELVPMNVVPDGTGRVLVLGKNGDKTARLLLDTGSSVTQVPVEQWAAGEGEEIKAQMGNVDVSGGISVVEGKAGDMELGPGVYVRGLQPIICGESGFPMLGMDGLKGVVLVHVPTEDSPHGLFLVGQ